MKILLEGDSWTRCWHTGWSTKYPDRSLLSKNFKYLLENDQALLKYLSDAGHDVTDNARGGSSNSEIHGRLLSYEISVTPPDLIVIFQTNPVRDLMDTNNPGDHVYYGKNIRNSLSHLTPVGFDKKIQSMCYNWYEDLNNLLKSKFPNTPVLLLGGNSKIEPATWKSFQTANPDTTMNVLHYSILEWLIDSFYYDPDAGMTFKHHTELTFPDWFEFIDESWNYDSVDYIYSKHVSMYPEIMPFTWPDTGHLNKHSLLILADSILLWAENNIINH